MYNSCIIYWSTKHLHVSEDRQAVSEHLHWAQTHSTPEEEARLMSRLEDLAKRFSTPQDTESGGDEGSKSEKE